MESKRKAELTRILAAQAELYGQVDNATWLARHAAAPAREGSLFDACEGEFMFSLPDTTPADQLAVPVGAITRRQAG